MKLTGINLRLVGTVLLLFVGAAPLRPAHGAELRLKAAASVAGSIIRLGDLAEIAAADPTQAQKLAALELFPTPPAGKTRFLSLAEIQASLVMRGIGAAEVTFSGASQVRVAQPERALSKPLATARPRRTEKAKLGGALKRRAQERAAQAVEAWLTSSLPGESGWRVSVELDDAAAAAIAAATEVEARCSSPPAVGQREFVAICHSDEGSQEVAVLAQIEMPPAIVVATHSVARGTLLTAADVRLIPAPEGPQAEAAYTRIEDVLGREAVRGLVVGQPLTAELVRSPILVRRGEPVTVWARSAGLRVRTTAVSRDDGSQGDLVTVESRQTRQSFFARVVGVQEVEVYARAVSAESEPLATAGQEAAR